MDKDYLVLKRAAASRPSGEWNDDDFDVLANGEVVGRIYKANAAPVGEPWMWTLIFPRHEGRTPTHGYAATREAGRAAFKSWCLKQLPEAVIEKTKNEIGGARFYNGPTPAERHFCALKRILDREEADYAS